MSSLPNEILVDCAIPSAQSWATIFPRVNIFLRRAERFPGLPLAVSSVPKLLIKKISTMRSPAPLLSLLSLVLQVLMANQAGGAISMPRAGSAGVPTNILRHTHQTSSFAPKSELLRWLNELIQADYTRVEQCANGVAYCKVMDALYKVSCKISFTCLPPAAQIFWSHNKEAGRWASSLQKDHCRWVCRFNQTS